MTDTSQHQSRVYSCYRCYIAFSNWHHLLKNEAHSKQVEQSLNYGCVSARTFAHYCATKSCFPISDPSLTQF